MGSSGLAQGSPGQIVNPGDVVGVAVTGEEELSRAYAVGEDGTIEMPIVGSVAIGGKSAEQARTIITQAIARYVRDPEVRFEILKTKGLKITISGDVNSPGVFEVRETVSLRDSLAFAGGALPTADLSQVTIARGNEVIRQDLRMLMSEPDPSQDIRLQDGDRITVPSRIIGSFTILGSVTNVGTYPVFRGMRVLDALKAAGGLQEGVKVDSMRIIRGDETLMTDINKLMFEGAAAENRVVLPDDTLVVASEEIGQSSFYVMGAVFRPGRYELKQRLTIMEAVAMAGGFTPTARQDRCNLVRKKENGEFTTLEIDFKKAFKDASMADMLIQDGDVINVPDAGPKKDPLQYFPILTPLLYLLL